MLKLIETAKRGNLKGLRKLKDDGVNLSKKDEDGTPALLLAVAHGYLTFVQWLLRDGGCKPSEKNCLGNNSLFLASNHGQLAIADYIVRYYYLKAIELFSKKPANYSEHHSLLNLSILKNDQKI